MTTTTITRRKHVKDGARPWSTIAVVVVTFAVIGSGLFVVGLLLDNSPATVHMTTPEPRALATSTPIGSGAPVASPTPPEPTDLVARARQIKPLDHILKSDRVLYESHLCRWQAWDGGINVSTIKCPGEPAFQVPTARLTPVELKHPATAKDHS